MAYSVTTPYDEYLRIEQTKYPELKIEDLQTLKARLANEPDLPPIPEKKYLAFLHSCYFDVELAIKTIKNYYKYHFEVPQVFCDLDPLSKDIENNYECVSLFNMPAVNTDKSDRVLFMQFKEHDHKLFDYEPDYKYMIMWMEYVLMTYGTCDGMICVFDSKGLGWRHIVKLPISLSVKMLKFLETGLPIRLKQIHILNTGTYTHMLLKLIMKFASQDLIDKIKIHLADSEDIFNYVPKKLMPAETGGLGRSHHYYNDQVHDDIINMRDYFLEQTKILNNQMSYNNHQHFLDDQ